LRASAGGRKFLGSLVDLRHILYKKSKSESIAFQATSDSSEICRGAQMTESVSEKADRQRKKSQRIITATPVTVRKVNRAIVLNLIRLHQPISRASLSRQTGIHRSNVSMIVEELLEEGLVHETLANPQGRGRVPFLLTLNPTSLHVIGVNLRVTETQVVLGQFNGEMVSLFSFPTPPRPEVFVAELKQHLENAFGGAHRAILKSIRKMVVSIPGMINSKKQLWVPALPGFSAFPLKAELERQTGFSASIANNAILGAAAEMWLGDKAGSRSRNFVFVVIGDAGVGTGLVLNRKLYRGHNNTFAGEFGHMIVSADNMQCPCGRQGCWQLYVSDHATWRRYDPQAKFDRAKFNEMIDRAELGEDAALKAIRETARYLALGLSNICLALNPEMIVVGGAITKIWNIVKGEIDKTIHAPYLDVNIRPAQQPLDELFLRGAVTLGLEQFFAAPELGLVSKH
jgi:predicted NBD/HSP70 family sugar kinase/chromosome segregation and condensation protein ScpB